MSTAGRGLVRRFFPPYPYDFTRYLILKKNEEKMSTRIFPPQTICMAFMFRSSKQSKSYLLTRLLATFHWKSSRRFSTRLCRRANFRRAFLRELLPFCFRDRSRLSHMSLSSEWKSTSGEGTFSPSELVKKFFMPKSKPADRPVFGLISLVPSLSRENNYLLYPV